MFWLNVDLPWRIWKLHREECRYCKPKDSAWKGINDMRRNGGWCARAPIIEEIREVTNNPRIYGELEYLYNEVVRYLEEHPELAT